MPRLDVEDAIQGLIAAKEASEAELNELATAAAREIRTKPIEHWATLLARCMHLLSHCARMTSEGEAVTWNPLRAGACATVISQIQKAIEKRPADNERGRSELGGLFGFVIGEQIFNEGNNRGAYFLAAMMGGLFAIPLPAQNKFKERDKTASGFFKNRVQAQFVDMY